MIPLHVITHKHTCIYSLYTRALTIPKMFCDNNN